MSKTFSFAIVDDVVDRAESISSYLKRFSTGCQVDIISSEESYDDILAEAIRVMSRKDVFYDVLFLDIDYRRCRTHRNRDMFGGIRLYNELRRRNLRGVWRRTVVVSKWSEFVTYDITGDAGSMELAVHTALMAFADTASIDKKYWISGLHDLEESIKTVVEELVATA